MNKKSFVEAYRERYESDKELPCIKCSDTQIESCSNIVIKNGGKNLGCPAFKTYEKLGTSLDKKVSKK